MHRTVEIIIFSGCCHIMDQAFKTMSFCIYYTNCHLPTLCLSGFVLEVSGDEGQSMSQYDGTLLMFMRKPSIGTHSSACAETLTEKEPHVLNSQGW